MDAVSELNEWIDMSTVGRPRTELRGDHRGLQCQSTVSVYEAFTHYFEKMSASGALPPYPTGVLPLDPAGGLSSFRPPHCPPLEKILRAPMRGMHCSWLSAVYHDWVNGLTTKELRSAPVCRTGYREWDYVAFTAASTNITLTMTLWYSDGPYQHWIRRRLMNNHNFIGLPLEVGIVCWSSSQFSESGDRDRDFWAKTFGRHITSYKNKPINELYLFQQVKRS